MNKKFYRYKAPHKNGRTAHPTGNRNDIWRRKIQYHQTVKTLTTIIQSISH